MRQNQVNNQQQRLIKSTRKYQYDSVGKSTILGIFATNLGSKWGPKSTEKCQKMSFLWKFSEFLEKRHVLLLCRCHTPKQHFIAMAYDQREIEYWYENNKIKNNDIELRQNLACFQTYRADA